MLRPNWLGVPVVLPLNILVEDRFVQLDKCVRVQWKLDEKTNLETVFHKMQGEFGNLTGYI